MSVMHTLRTVAKIGRSMKKRDSMADRSSPLGSTGGLGALAGRRSRWRRRAQRRHGRGLRLDLRARADLLEPADQDPIVGLQALVNHAQAVFLKRPGRDPAILDLV